MRKLKHEGGFSLLEVLLSLALLGLGGIVLAFVLGNSLKMLSTASLRTVENAESAGELEVAKPPGGNTLTIDFGTDSVTVNGEYASSGPYTRFVPS